MSEYDEDVLASFGSGVGINKGLRNVGLVHVEITTQDTPKHTFKGSNPSAVDRTSDKPEDS